MTNVTLESIKDRQNELNAMIQNFEAANLARNIEIEHQVIKLNPGEKYAGLILNDDNEPSYHLILLPDRSEDAKWYNAKKWAKEMYADLPTRQEQALLYANLKDEFDPVWHWSKEQNVSNLDYVWCQIFTSGSQNDFHRDNLYRARAVRRVTILNE